MINLQNPAIVGMIFLRPSDVTPCKIEFGIQGISELISAFIAVLWVALIAFLSTKWEWIFKLKAQHLLKSAVFRIVKEWVFNFWQRYCICICWM